MSICTPRLYLANRRAIPEPLCSWWWESILHQRLGESFMRNDYSFYSPEDWKFE